MNTLTVKIGYFYHYENENGIFVTMYNSKTGRHGWCCTFVEPIDYEDE